MDEKKFKVHYEKTYGSGNTDQYSFRVDAKSIQEASAKAERELRRLDMMATWSTDITDALLEITDGEVTDEDKAGYIQLPLPLYLYASGVSPSHEDLRRTGENLQRKQYGLRREDEGLNFDCYDFRCDGVFSHRGTETTEYGSLRTSMKCSYQETHKRFHKRDTGEITFWNSTENIEERTAEILDALRGTKEDALEKFEWLKRAQHFGGDQKK